MKLELKHLAPYLPYDLKILDGWGDIRKLRYVHLDDNGNKGSIFGIRPILHPLSDLTKEIEHNGEKFVPLEICDLYNAEFDYPYINNNEAGFVYGFSAHKVLDLKNIFKNEYWKIQKLFEWHFDIFGLIDAGLAIDINTLGKENNNETRN